MYQFSSKLIIIKIFIALLLSSCAKEKEVEPRFQITDPAADIILYEDESSQKGILGKFQFVDDEIGFIYSTKIILETNDGGFSWSTLYQLEKTNNGVYSEFYGAYFENENKGIISGWGSDGNRFFKRTENGGNSWIDMNNHQVSSTSIGRVWRLKNRFIMAPYNSVYLTIDDGTNWTRPFFDINSTNQKGYTIDFINENLGFIYGENYYYKTVNGGASWEKVGSMKDVHHIDFATAEIGIKTSGSGWAYYTDDGGISWDTTRKADEHAINDLFKTSFFVNENNAFIIGVNTVYRSFDGGKTYSVILHLNQDKGVHYTFDNIHMFNTSKGLINARRIEYNERNEISKMSHVILHTATGWE